MPFPDGDWSSTEASEFLGISGRWLYYLTKSGRLRPTKRGDRWHFNPIMVKAYRELKRLPRGRVFVAEVVNRYFSAYRKYQIIRKPNAVYWLKIRSRHIVSGERFNKIKFCIRRLHSFGGGIRLVIIEPEYFARLPETHRQQWIDNEFIL